MIKNFNTNFHDFLALGLSEKLFLLGLFLKQFYVFPSGNFQMGDLLLLLSFFSYFFFHKRAQIIIHKDEFILLLFIGFTITINLIYTVILSASMMKSCIYYLFNFFIVILFSQLMKTDDNKLFFNCLFNTFCCALFSQFIIFVLGFGKWYSESRYEGTFNDPNQFGVYIFLSTLLIAAVGNMINKKSFPWAVLGFVLILFSSSTGTLLGFTVLFFSKYIFSTNYGRKKSIIIICLCLAFLTIILGIEFGMIEVPSIVVDSSMYHRLFTKLDTFFNDSSGTSLFVDRGWTRIIQYPEYLLYGSGEGCYYRFNTILEIHSSILAPIFYYGILPATCLFYWYYSKLKSLKRNNIYIYLALFAESFFIVNLRQPMFWILIVIAKAVGDCNIIYQEKEK